MTVLRRSRLPAQARVAATLPQYHAVASWGPNGMVCWGTGPPWAGGSTGRSGTSSDLTQVAAGLVHVLAVRSDATVWAWGANWKGELGDGSTTERSEPVQVAGLTGITQVAAGSGSAWRCGPTARCGPGVTTRTASWAAGRSPITRSRRAGWPC